MIPTTMKLQHDLLLPGLAVLLPCTMATAQPRMDISLHTAHTGDREVLLHPDGDFNGLVSSVVFTVTWPANAPEPVLRQTAEERNTVHLQPSGPTHERGATHYRIYCGLGFQRVQDLGMAIHEGQSRAIGRFEGAADLSIVDAPWVRERAINGAFYVSLNGLDRTGEVLRKQVTSADMSTELEIELGPNPSNGGGVWYQLRSPVDGELTLSILDAEGSVVQRRQVMVQAGRASGTLPSVDQLASGTYSVTAEMQDVQRSSRLVINGRR